MPGYMFDICSVLYLGEDQGTDCTFCTLLCTVCISVCTVLIYKRILTHTSSPKDFGTQHCMLQVTTGIGVFEGGKGGHYPPNLPFTPCYKRVQQYPLQKV